MMAPIDYFGAEKANLRGFLRFCSANSLLVISVTLALFCAYGIKLCFYSIGIDTEYFITGREEFLSWNIQIGRWGLSLLQGIWQIKEFNPVFTFATTFCFIWLFAMVWCYIIAVFGKNTGRSNSLVPFALILVTSSVWVEQFYFVFMATETAAMVALCPVVCYLLYKGFLEARIGVIACAFVLLVLMLSVYQALAPLFISGVLVCFVLLQENSSYAPKVYRWLSIKLLVTLVMALAVWMLFTKLALAVFHLKESHYVEEMNKWGAMPLRDGVMNILIFGYRITIGHVTALQAMAEPLVAKYSGFGMAAAKAASSASRITGNVLLLPAAILYVALMAIGVAKIPAGRRFLYFFAGLGIPLSIFMLPLLGGSQPPVRAMYSLPLVSAFMLYALSVKTGKSVGRVIVILSVAVSIYQAQTAAQLLYSDYVRYQDDVRLAYELDRAIAPLGNSNSGTPGPESLPVAIVGAHRSADVFLREEGFLQGEVMGHSFFEWSSKGPLEGGSRGIPFMRTLGLRYMQVDEAQMDTARTVAREMPSYPAAGAVQRLANMIVVKLSESTYRSSD